MSGEQPLVADVEELPRPGDASLVCTNVRLMNGKRPHFIDDSASLFVFPLGHIRFVEIPPHAMGRQEEDVAQPEDGQRDELELDEDFLRRIREA